MSKEEWKESGKEMGHAWTTFGKTFVRSAKTTGGKVAEWADDQKVDTENPPDPNSSVYADGSWKTVGKELGGAFAGVGKSLLHTVGINSESDEEKK